MILIHCIGHPTAECTNQRALDRSRVADMDAEAAWAALEKADKERDLDDIRAVSSEDPKTTSD